jgi:hypothetical protein
MHTPEQFLARWIQVVHSGFWNIVPEGPVFYVLPGKDHEARTNHWAFEFERICLGTETVMVVPVDFFKVERI